MKPIPDYIISWSCSFSSGGTAGGSLHCLEKIDTGTEVELTDAVGRLFFTGYVTAVTRTESGVGYEMELSDPLSAGYLSHVSFDGAAHDFPAHGTKEEIDNYCGMYDLDYRYTAAGRYAIGSGGSECDVNDAEIIQRVVREGVMNGEYYNRLIVRGSAEKSIAAEVKNTEVTIGGITFDETYQGDRMLSRTISGPDIDTEETWAWNESNVCVSHTALDKTPAPAQFGEGAMNETKTAITVSNIGGDISEYHIHKTIEYKEYGIGIKGVIPNQQTVIGKYTTRTEETNIQRNADGSGEKETIVEEAARNRYYAVMTLPVYDDSNNITGSKEIQIPYFDFYKRLPESKERTVYRRKDGRPYSVTQTWKAKMNVTGLEDAYISLVPDTVSYGTEEPEQPEMEEAVETISAEVEYIIEFDQDIGTYERSETLPDIPIPEVVLNSKQLYDWLWNRAKKYANRKRRQFMLLDEMTIRGRLRDDIEIGWKVGEFTVTGVRHSVSADTVETAITGVRPSVQTVPLRRSANAMSMLIKTAREMDKAQDNIRQAQVVRPVSSRRALANIGGKNYVVANPKGGPLFAGDKISVYRETGSAKEGA